MNDKNKIIPFIKKWEGGLGGSSNDASSSMMCPTPVKGKYYHTNKGITYRTWVGVFGKYNNGRWITMNDADWSRVFTEKFWDVAKCDSIPYASIAFYVIEIGWMSGALEGVETLQEVLNKLTRSTKDGVTRSILTEDGHYGPKTDEVLRSFPEKVVFDACIADRRLFFQLITDGKADTEKRRIQEIKNRVYLNGWNNRLNQFVKTFQP